MMLVVSPTSDFYLGWEMRPCIACAPVNMLRLRIILLSHSLLKIAT